MQQSLRMQSAPFVSPSSTAKFRQARAVRRPLQLYRAETFEIDRVGPPVSEDSDAEAKQEEDKPKQHAQRKGEPGGDPHHSGPDILVARQAAGQGLTLKCDNAGKATRGYKRGCMQDHGIRQAPVPINILREDMAVDAHGDQIRRPT